MFVPPRNNIIFANIHNTTVINNVIKPAASAGAGCSGRWQYSPQRQGWSCSAGVAGAGGATPAGTGPALPPAVAQKASLIQQENCRCAERLD